MKRQHSEIAVSHLYTLGSSSSDNLRANEGFQPTVTSNRTNNSSSRRSIRPRTYNNLGMLSGYPVALATSLQEIITRYNNWANAVNNGNTGISQKAYSELKHCMATKDEPKQLCTLCLENIKPGEEYTKLACGHVFHKGKENGSDATEGCKGILYWLRSNLTCPHCRVELESAVPTPSDSEKLMIPLLNRQFVLIQAQARMLERQKQQLEALQQNSRTKRRKCRRSQSQRNAANEPTSSIPEPIPPVTTTFATGSGFSEESSSEVTQWQDGFEHHVYRKIVLQRVTEIAMDTLNWRLAGWTDTRMKRLNALAAKVELLLFSEASSLEEYKDMVTLKARVINKIKGLIWRAKQLKRSREANRIHCQPPIVNRSGNCSACEPHLVASNY